jgi:hypothetical protein
MIKVLVLIIACDSEPFYAGHREQWRRYMNQHPLIQSYFIRHTTDLEKEHNDPHTLWLQGNECGFQIYDKTAKALRVLLADPRFAEVEYIVRTNLSSFYIWDRLLERLKHAPRTGWVFGRIVQQADMVPYPSGCGMVFSRDIGELWATAPCPEKQRLADDWAFGYLLRRHGIPIEPAECFMLPDEDTMVHFKERILTLLPATAFHVRLRCGTPKERLRYETANYAFLIDTFYPQTLPA